MNTKEKTLHSKLLCDENPRAVYEGLLGTAFSYRKLVLLENYKILLRRDHRTMIGKVKILAGGGAGLQESGFVGVGMLTGIVLGDIFVAPPASCILAAIRELAYEHQDGILLLVKNYTGDWLNFGLALERAINENITIKMLLIGDDSGNTDPEKYGRKGSAGSVLIYKIAGAMAEAGKSLDDIFSMCRERILTDLSTVNVCFTPPRYLKWEKSDFAVENEAMFGMGIYGQSGVKRKYNDLFDCICIMLDSVLHVPSQTGFSTDQIPVIVLLNNLGALSGLEENFISLQIVKELIARNYDIVRFYAGTLMPLLDCRGFSISILKVTDSDSLVFLDAPTTAFNWPKSSDTTCFDIKGSSSMKTSQSKTNLPCTIQPVLDHDQLDNQKYQEVVFEDVFRETEKNIIHQTIYFAAEALISCEKQINIIDLEVGDGDAGTMMKNGASAIKEALEESRVRLGHPFTLLQDLGNIIERRVGGTAGALYSVFFGSASKIFLKSDVNMKSWCEAFKAGVKAIKCYGKAEIGERTLLDVLYPAVDVFELAIRKNDHLHRLASNIACTCEYHAEETKKVKPVLVRGNQPKTNLVYPDAGAHAAAVWIRAVCEAIKLNFPVDTFEPDLPACGPGIFLWKFITEEEAEFILNGDTSKQQILDFFYQKSGNDSVQQMLFYEIALYCRKNYGNEIRKASALMGVVYFTHLYFKASRWRTPNETYDYFKESLLRQSMEYPPTSTEVFTPEEARDALLFFVEIYMRNLPLIRLLCLPHYKLRLNFKNGVDSEI